MIYSLPGLSSYSRKILFLSFAFSLLVTLSCESKESKARKAVEEHLKNQGLRELKVEMFYPSKETPGKAYIAVDVTHSFASGEGTFQHEYLGYILKQEGQGWVVEKSVSYTKEQEKAENLIAGRK